MINLELVLSPGYSAQATTQQSSITKSIVLQWLGSADQSPIILKSCSSTGKCTWKRWYKSIQDKGNDTAVTQVRGGSRQQESD